MTYSKYQIVSDHMHSHNKRDEEHSVSTSVEPVNKGDQASPRPIAAATDRKTEVGPTQGRLITLLLYFGAGAGVFISLAWCVALFLLLLKGVMLLIAYYYP